MPRNPAAPPHRGGVQRVESRRDRLAIHDAAGTHTPETIPPTDKNLRIVTAETIVIQVIQMRRRSIVDARSGLVIERVPRGHELYQVATTAIDIRQLGTVDYRTAWQLQRDLVDARVAAAATRYCCSSINRLHRGRRTEPQERPADGTPVVDTDRGARSPGMVPGSWSATRSSGWPNRWMSSITFGALRNR